MADTFAISGLVRKRAELAGEIEALETKLRGLWESLAHVDATILLFDPAHDLAGIKPKKLAYDAGPFMHGELSRLILDVLRPATEPMSVTEIAAAIIRRKGLTDDASMRTYLGDRVDKALRRHGKLVERVELGLRAVGWKIGA